MDGLVLRISIIIIAFIIVQVVMDFKYKNFIPEINYNIISFVVYCLIIFNGRSIKGFHESANDSYILIIGLAVILAIFVILRKNKFYHFKGIDKKFIEEKEIDILDIISKYKNTLYDKSEISIVNNRIIFENVKKTQVRECLSLIGSYLDANRKKYTFKDYLIHYTKTYVLPSVIAIAALFIFFKALSYDPPILDAEEINIVDEFVIGNTEDYISMFLQMVKSDLV